MNVVTIRDFQRNLYRFIRAREDIVVTSRGKEAFKVAFTRNVVTKDVVTTPIKVVTTNNVVTLDNKNSTYRCGCDRLANKIMCSKHNRL